VHQEPLGGCIDDAGTSPARLHFAARRTVAAGR
jgi:hypothetical protein